MINHELLSRRNLVHIVLTCFILVRASGKVAGGDGKDGGMDSLEELITRELKEAFDEFDKVPRI